MPNGNKLLILTEAGEGIGFGHYSRCSAIKSYFEGENVPTDIFLNVKGEQTSEYKAIVGDWMPNINAINTANYSHVLLDSYLSPLSIFSLLKTQFDSVIAL